MGGDILPTYYKETIMQIIYTTKKDLIKQIDTTYFVGWPDLSMQEWTWGCDQGPNGHFLQTGHIRVAEKVYEHMEKVQWHV